MAIFKFQSLLQTPAFIPTSFALWVLKTPSASISAPTAPWRERVLSPCLVVVAVDKSDNGVNDEDDNNGDDNNDGIMMV